MERKQLAFLIIGFIAVIFLLQRCNDNTIQRLRGEGSVLQELYMEQKDLVNALEEQRIRERDSLSSLIFLREKRNQELASENTALRKRINDIRAKPIVTPKTIEGLTLYFNRRYNTEENVSLNNAVNLKQTTASNVVEDLELGDKAVEIVELQDSIIKNQDDIITNLSDDKGDLKTMLDAAENEIAERKRLEELADRNIKNLKGQNRNLRRQTKLNRVLIPAAFVGGFLIGQQIGN